LYFADLISGSDVEGDVEEAGHRRGNVGVESGTGLKARDAGSFWKLSANQ
jgi:hypothetical protein